MSRKYEKDNSSRTGVITDNLFSVRKWGNKQTDRHTRILKYLELVYKHPRNVSKKFKKDSSSRTRDITDNLFSVKKGGNEHTKYIQEIDII